MAKEEQPDPLHDVELAIQSYTRNKHRVADAREAVILAERQLKQKLDEESRINADFEKSKRTVQDLFDKAKNIKL